MVTECIPIRPKIPAVVPAVYRFPGLPSPHFFFFSSRSFGFRVSVTESHHKYTQIQRKQPTTMPQYAYTDVQTSFLAIKLYLAAHPASSWRLHLVYIAMASLRHSVSAAMTYLNLRFSTRPRVRARALFFSWPHHSSRFDTMKRAVFTLAEN